MAAESTQSRKANVGMKTGPFQRKRNDGTKKKHLSNSNKKPKFWYPQSNSLTIPHAET